MVGSVLQPLIGLHTDAHPKPCSLVVGMAVTLCGLVLLALASSYPVILAAAAMIGMGSAIFHPEASRMARLASGGRHGFAQSLFQVGGNAGTAFGPLLAASIIVPRGQRSILLFTGLAFAGMMILSRVGAWYAMKLAERSGSAGGGKPQGARYSRGVILSSMSILLVLIFSKFFYIASMTSYYTFFTMQKFGVSVQASQFYLFCFLGAGAVGTIVGGPIGDRIGRKAVIWVSVLGAAPFALLMPHANLFWTVVLTMCTGLILSSAFPAIVVYATELLPAKVGLVAGLFFGLSFGMAGVGSALLGRLADATSLSFVMHACAYLPLLGLLAAFLPNTRLAPAGR
jgi:FSR family fosmidomycin resistance protein-like MFS transporter